MRVRRRLAGQGGGAGAGGGSCPPAARLDRAPPTCSIRPTPFRCLHPSCAADALLAFAEVARGDNRAALADWRAGSDPCRWLGVTCSAGGAVTALRLLRMGLRGTLDPNLARLNTLQQM